MDAREPAHDAVYFLPGAAIGNSASPRARFFFNMSLTFRYYPLRNRSKEMTQDQTREARRALGRQAREKCSRLVHADWDPKLRKSSPINILNASEKGRVSSLLPEKHKRMMASPFSYYRGAAPVMAADLSLLPKSGLLTQICGDAHVYNLGSFTALDGHIIFDINDFDETIPGPWEWDVKRMSASLVLVGRESGARDSACKEAVLDF